IAPSDSICQPMSLAPQHLSLGALQLHGLPACLGPHTLPNPCCCPPLPSWTLSLDPIPHSLPWFLVAFHFVQSPIFVFLYATLFLTMPLTLSNSLSLGSFHLHILLSGL